MRSTHAHISIPMTWLSKQLSLHPLSCIYSYDKPMGELRHGQTTVVPNYTVTMVSNNGSCIVYGVHLLHAQEILHGKA